MNLRLKHFLSKQTISHLSRLNPRSSSAIVATFNLTSHPNATTPLPNPPPFHFHSSKSLHSSPDPNFPSTAETAVIAATHNNDEEDDAVADAESAALNEFLSRFVHRMRGNLTAVYPDCEKQTVDAMLVLIVEKLVAQLDKGESLEAMDMSRGDLSEDLWRLVHEVSTAVYLDMEREKKKETMKRFLQSEKVKEMARFAGEVGVRGDVLRELRFKWAREAMEENEFYERLHKLGEETKKEENVDEGDEATGVDNGNKVQADGVGGLPKRHGKIKYKLYGLDLSGPKWKEVADKIHEAEEVAWPQEAKPITGKCRLVTEKILALGKDDDPLPLLAEWAELLEPKRVDWMSLLEKIKERDMSLYLKVAEHVLGEPSFETDTRDYSKLADIYAKENRLEDVERILKKMSENGMPPDMITLTGLVHMYCKAGNIEQAKQAFETLRSQGFKPDFQVYRSMIMAYANVGQPQLGEALLRELETRDIRPPTEEIYMALLRGFAAQGNCSGADRMETCMKFAGFDPTLESYTLLVEAWGKSGDPVTARRNFDHMMRMGFKPSDRCTAAMISAYEKKNELDKAVNLLLQLEKDGFQPGVSTYCALVYWFSKLQLVDEAEQMLGKVAQLGEAPPFKIQVILCDMYSRAGIEKKARHALEILEAKKELLEHEDFLRVIDGLSKGGFVQDALRIRGLMEAQGFTVPEDVDVNLKAAQAWGGSRGGNRTGMR